MAKRKIENATIEVILLESDKYLGEKYETVRVKPIYARNVLLPGKKAVLADAMNKNNYAQKIEAGAKEIAKKLEALQSTLDKISADDGLTLSRKVNKDNHLYAKVDVQDIVKEIQEKYGLAIHDHLFKMKKKIAEPGTYIVPFMYKEYKADITVHVVAEKDAKDEAQVEANETVVQDS